MYDKNYKKKIYLWGYKISSKEPDKARKKKKFLKEFILKGMN